MEQDITAILPVFNEERRILSTLKQLEQFNSERPNPVKFMLVDDGSTDKTFFIAKDFSRSRPWINCIKLPGNMGKGAAIKEGVTKADGKFIFFMDADLPVPLQTITQAISILENDAEIILGSRTHPESRILNQTPYRKVISRIGNMLIRMSTGLPFRDTQCGFKGFTRVAAQDLFSRLKTDGYMFDVEILIMASRAGFRIREIPVEWSHVPDGSFNPLTDSIKMLRELFRIGSITKQI